ncbi:MAG: hypothetical protein AB1333_03140 [Patescibacteria group bacterium]
MKIPYSEIELRITLATLSQDEKRLRRMNKKVDELKKKKDKIWDPPIKNKQEFNKKTAEFHDITIETLINSKNYKILCDEYYTYLYEKLVQKLMRVFKLTHKEVWAIIAEKEKFFSTL